MRYLIFKKFIELLPFVSVAFKRNLCLQSTIEIDVIAALGGFCFCFIIEN